MKVQPRVSLILSLSETTPRNHVNEFAKLVEDSGYDTLWVGESWGRELFTVLTDIACHTKNIKLGSGIANIYSRTPALLAQAAATIDEVAEGRFSLGLGTSGEKVIRDWHGVPFEKPLQRTREYIDIINLAISGERVNYQGEIFKVKDFRLRVRPQRKHIPIYIAALGPKNIELTGELADGWNPVFLSLSHLKESTAVLEAGAKKHGRSLKDIDIAANVPTFVSDDVAAAKKEARLHICYYVGSMGKYYYNLMVRYGYGEQAARIQKNWKAGDKDAAAGALSDEMLHDLAIAGTASQCQERILEYLSKGVTPVLLIPPLAGRSAMAETVKAIAPKTFRG